MTEYKIKRFWISGKLYVTRVYATRSILRLCVALVRRRLVANSHM